MALVAYDASSGEESEIDDEDSNAQVIIPKETSPKQNGVHTNDNVSENLFNALPNPKLDKGAEIIEEDDEFLHKKAVPEEKKPKPKVKIGIPSLSQFDSDDDEPKAKKVKPQVKGSGLFSILPPPKTTPVSTKSFVPHSVAKKTTSKPLVPQQVKKPSAKASISKKSTKVKSNEDGAQTDDSDLDDIEVPETFNEELWAKVCGQKPKKAVVQEIQTVEAPQTIEIAPEPVKPYSGLDNEGFKQLVGKMRKKEEIEITEIREDDILPDKDVWMVKALTDPTQEPKYVVKDPVNDTCKRKHHITYLAQQAKANEQELQNQWSANKFSRMQSRSKYGF